MAQAFNPTTKAEVVGSRNSKSPWSTGQLGLHREHILKDKKRKKKKKVTCCTLAIPTVDRFIQKD